MLLWCPQKDTTAVLPRTIVYRSKVSLSLELTCHVEEIVGSDETARGKQRKRDQSLELMSERRVFEQMRKSRVTVPAGRETEAYKQVQEEGMRAKDDEVEQNASGTSVPARSWHKELEYLQQRFVAGDFAKAEGMLPGNRGKNTTGARLTPEYARLAELERNIKWVRKKTGATEQLLQEQAEIDALDTQAHNLPQEDPQQQAILQEMEERKERLQRRLDDTRSPQTRDDFEYFKHERKAFDHNPPLLMWDQRRADPLMAYSEEFYPGNGLCLLDIQPEHSPPYPMTTAESDVFSPLISALWQNGKVNVTTLDQIAPGAVDALVPKVPALTDPSRGGERDVRDLPISRLTPEMAYGLTKAWVDWPFKPDLVDLLRKSSHSQEDDSDRRRLRRM